MIKQTKKKYKLNYISQLIMSNTNQYQRLTWTAFQRKEIKNALDFTTRILFLLLEKTRNNK